MASRAVRSATPARIENGRRRIASSSPTRRSGPTGSSSTRPVKSGRLAVGCRASQLSVDHARRRRSAPTIRRRICCMSAPPTCSASRRAEGVAGRPDRLRFDFSHHQAARRRRIESVEAIANRHRRSRTRRSTTRLMAVDGRSNPARMALFGEKYGDEVRVVTMGTAPRGRQRPAKLVGRAVRRHPCRAHRRYRTVASPPKAASRRASAVSRR
jgi:alanyl-tRNA synthetase